MRNRSKIARLRRRAVPVLRERAGEDLTERTHLVGERRLCAAIAPAASS